MATTRVITGLNDNVRFSYVHVFEPSAMEEGMEKKYSVSLIIPKENKKLIKEIEEAIQTALEEGKAKFGGKVPKVFKNPLRDGDKERPDDESYENCMFVNANANRKPGVIDQYKKEITDPEEFYSGCYGRASVNFFAFNVAGNKGVAAGLNNVQKTEDGEKLGGARTSATDDFGAPDDANDLM